MRYAASDLNAFVVQALTGAGARRDDAEIVADGLVCADLRGVHSHGVTRTGIYVARLRAGSINRAAILTLVSDTGPLAVVDAQSGLGVAMAVRAMDLAIERAQRYGIGAVGVRNSNHCGMLAYPALRAADRRLVGIAMSNADAQVAPWGARTRYLGTNPLAIAIPAGEEPPIVLDMATSIVAHGRIQAAAEGREAIPAEWALDQDGRPTTDPLRALRGALRPFGGHKGSGLGLMIDILAGILPGALSGPEAVPLYEAVDRPQGVGHFFLALSLEGFGSADSFLHRIDRLIREIRSLPPADGHASVCLPGEIEYRRMRDHREQGIPLPSQTVAAIERMAVEMGLAIPRPRPASVGERMAFDSSNE